MELFRCRICGEVYFGKHPTHCPFCGAHGRFLVSIFDWTDENAGLSLSDTEIQNLKTTRDLEYENTRFYRAVQKETKNDEVRAYFKYLAKIENEHYNVAVKILGEEKDPTILEPSNEMGSDEKNLEHSKQKETHAAKLYSEFLGKSPSERIKTFFEALSEVESDHIELDVEQLKKIQ